MSSPPNITRPDASATQVVISLGANLDSHVGEPAASLRAAIEQLRALAAEDFSASALYRTTPIDCPEGTPDFLNAAVVMTVAAEETPQGLLDKLHKMEAEFGRVRNNGGDSSNEPRCLDLDLIAFGATQSSNPGLRLPHPRAHERQFVLQPLAELQPELILPGQRETVAELLLQLPGHSFERCYKYEG